MTWLQELGWEVYQEVQIEAGARVADIVAVQGPKVWIVEAKRHLGLSVVNQAVSWCGYAHRISVATPPASYVPAHVLGELRLGLLTVDRVGCVREARAATPRQPDRILVGNLRDALCPEMKTYAPAGSRGRRWTPFRATAERLREYVQANPGATLKTAVGELQHHYTSDKVAVHRLDRLVSKRKVPGVVGRFEGNDYRLFPAEAS